TVCGEPKSHCTVSDNVLTGSVLSESPSDRPNAAAATTQILRALTSLQKCADGMRLGTERVVTYIPTRAFILYLQHLNHSYCKKYFLFKCTACMGPHTSGLLAKEPRQYRRDRRCQVLW